MGDRAAGKTYTTLVWEDEDVGQRFKGFVVGDGRQEEREEAGVGNEMFVIVEVLAEARRCPLMSSIHRSAWNRNSRKFRQRRAGVHCPRPFSPESLPQCYGAGLGFTTVRM